MAKIVTLETLYKIPAKVKKNASEGLKLRSRFQRGGTAIGLRTAQYLVDSTHIDLDSVLYIANYFPRHQKDNLDQDGSDGKPPSNGYIAWQLWGGNEGRDWSQRLKARFEGFEAQK